MDAEIEPMKSEAGPPEAAYAELLTELSALLDASRRAAARAVNPLMTATYWLVGWRVIEFEQGGRERAGYGEALLKRLAGDLSARFGRGYSADNLESMRRFYAAFPPERISETLFRKSNPDEPPRPAGAKSETLSRIFDLPVLKDAFPLSWSHYVMLVRRTRSSEALHFYHEEALRGGWSVRQLDRQIATAFYERTALSRNKAAMLRKGAKARPEDGVTTEEELRDPFMLEFLGLKDEYSETELEEALLRHLESFLLELGNDFAFVGRQRRLRIGHEWYRVDLLFFHRRLRCLVIIDLKVGKFTHADAGQMHTYLNYARKHWTHEGENPPVGLILCSEPDDALAQYSLDGLPNKVMAREYRLALPQEKQLVAEMEKTRHFLETHRKQ